VRRWSKVILWSMVFWACAGPSRSPLHAPPPLPQVWTQACGGLRVQIALQRAHPSSSVSAVYLTDLSGQPLADDTRMVLAFTAKGTDSTTTMVARSTGGGQYVLRSGFTLTSGPWRIEVIVRRANAAEVACVFFLNLSCCLRTRDASLKCFLR
jgi:hypothetical protein